MADSVAPLTSTAPFTITWSYRVPAVVPFISTANVLPGSMVRLPFIVNTPGLMPGERVPPPLIRRLPETLPVPPGTAPDPAPVFDVADTGPVTSRLPALMLVAPV